MASRNSYLYTVIRDIVGSVMGVNLLIFLSFQLHGGGDQPAKLFLCIKSTIFLWDSAPFIMLTVFFSRCIDIRLVGRWV